MQTETAQRIKRMIERETRVEKTQRSEAMTALNVYTLYLLTFDGYFMRQP